MNHYLFSPEDNLPQATVPHAISSRRCPKCGCSMLVNDEAEWCTFVGGREEKACDYIHYFNGAGSGIACLSGVDHLERAWNATPKIVGGNAGGAPNFGMATVDMVRAANAGLEPQAAETHLRIVSASASQPKILPNACGSSDNSGIEPVKSQPPQAHIPLADVQGCRLTAGAGANLLHDLKREGIAEEALRMNPSENVSGREIRSATSDAAGSTPAPAPISSALNRGVPSPTRDGGSMIPAAVSPEDSIQERGGFFEWLVFHVAAAWVSVFKNKALIDDKEPCAWCQREQSIKSQPHETHGICERHKQQLIADAKKFGKSKFA